MAGEGGICNVNIEDCKLFKSDSSGVLELVNIYREQGRDAILLGVLIDGDGYYITEDETAVYIDVGLINKIVK